MVPGPTVIYECGHCSGLIEYPTIASGNTFGARVWTDGKMDAPMLPDMPLLVKCPHCRSMVWITEQKEVGKMRPWLVDRHPYPSARPYEEPTVDDYVGYLAESELNADKEFYARVRLWWLFNDGRRYASRRLPLTAREIENLTALLDLMNDDATSEPLGKAEILRELGRFDEALALLTSIPESERSKAVLFLVNLARLGDPYVREYPD